MGIARIGETRIGENSMSKFLAKYTAPDQPTKYRTIWGDELRDATMIAERWSPKGYILTALTQKLGED